MITRPVRLALLCVGVLLIPGPVQGQAPQLTGTVDLDLHGGRITGDMCVAGLPEQDSLRFLLHRGLSIESIRDASGRLLRYRGHSDLVPVDVALEYTVIDSLADLRTLCVEYTGAYPVYDDQQSTFDYQEVIAFTGRTVRAAASTAWYPVPHDPEAERRYEDMRYDLRVRCPACTTIYLNGTRPLPGPEAVITSSLPYSPLLFAGQYDFREVAGSLFLNSQASDQEARVLSEKVAGIQNFFAEFLGVPYGDTLVFLHHQPIERFRPGRVWGFAPYPTFAYAGIDFGDFARGLTETPPNPALWGLLAHETAHYYFGTLLSPHGAYAPFFGESTADYLALKAVRRFVGEEPYRAALARYFKEVVNGPALPPLDRAPAEALRRDLYRYRYGPLLLVALEREIGEARMGKLLHRLVTAPTGAVLDYAYLKQAALKAGVPRAAWERYERRCVAPEPRESCLREFAEP